MRQLYNVALGLILTAATSAYAESPYKEGKYNIDPMHSKVGFEIPHLVISTVEGKFTDFSGQFDLKQKFTSSVVNAEINLNSIDTGVSKRDDHLRSPDFFDVKKYPKMSFKSTKIEGNKESFKMTGELSLHGVTKKVVFEGKYLGTVTDGYGNKKVAFVAKTQINRKDFGLSWSSVVEAGPVVGDTVSIDLKIQAALAEKSEQKISASSAGGK